MRSASLISVLILAAVGIYAYSPRASLPSSGRKVERIAAPFSLRPPLRAESLRPSAGHCQPSFEVASSADAMAFLNGLSGRWFDALRAPLLEDEDQLHEGLTITGSGIQLTRFSVENSTMALKFTKSLSETDSLQISATTKDGFRMAVLVSTKRCALVALKPAPENKIYVRGPLLADQALLQSEDLYRSFRAATAEDTRIFEKLPEAKGQITAVLPGSALPLSVTPSKPAL